MVLNFDVVEISSLNGFDRWGEFKNENHMVAKLEELRNNGEIHSDNCSVMMTGLVRQKSGTYKKLASYRLSFLDGQWTVCLNMPKNLSRLDK